MFSEISRNRWIFGLFAAVLTLGLATACEEQSSAEKAGEQMEQTGEAVGEAVEQAGEAASEAMEQTGEQVEQAAEEVKKE